MPKYKIGASSKLHKKYNFIFDAKNENEARERIHNDGYSILDIEEIKNKDILGKKFYFISTFKGIEKKGQVIGKDIFKVFLKLKELGYIVSELYEEGDKNFSFSQKEKIIKNLEGQYAIFNFGKNKQSVTNLIKDNDLGKINLKNFYMKKNLEENYRLIDLVLNKLGNILNKKIDYNLEEDKQKKLQDIYNNLLKLKKITNITKLKTIGELALIKIGGIELEKLEKTKDIKTKVLLKETNKLLKQVGSNKQFFEKEKDIKLILKDFFKKITKKKVLKAKINIDKNSYGYMKNLLFLSKYKNTLKQNKLGILKQIKLFIFNKEEFNRKKIKIKVIKQNIAILTARKKGKITSYTKIVKSTKGLLNGIIVFFDNINKYIFDILSIYIIYFIFTLNLVGSNINYEGMYLFLLIFVLYILIGFSRNIILLILNFVFLYFIIIFGNINF